MKKIVIICLVLIHLLACDKENTQPVLEYLDSIIAGQTEGLGVKYSGKVNDTLIFHPYLPNIQYIDINDDGIKDFELGNYGTSSPGHDNYKTWIITIGNSFLAAPELENNIVDTLTLNDTIDFELNWVNDTCVLYNYHWYFDSTGEHTSDLGLWNDVKNKYIGTKLFVDNKELYGWIRVEINYNGYTLTLIDYASTVGYEQD